MSRIVLYPGNDQILTLPDVKDADGNAITGATITATLYKKENDELADPAFDHVTMTDVAGVAGSYECQIPADLAAAIGSLYYVLYECSDPGIFAIRQKASVRTRWI